MSEKIHPHFERNERTDPMTGNTITDVEGHPFVIEGEQDEGIKIYFESEETKKEYLEIQEEHPENEMQKTLDNPTDEINAEG